MGETHYTPRDGAKASDHESVSCYRHLPCVHCGRAGHAHEKERVHHDNGTWSYNYVCPT
jgi:hypothetical protein